MRKLAASLVASLLFGGPAMSADVQQPIGLKIENHGDFLDVVVVSDAVQPTDARFELEISSAGQGGTTRTVQSGTSRGRPAGETLLSSRIRTTGMAGWNARLHVTVGGREYVVLKSG